MPRESTIQILRSTTTDTPTGLTFGEIAYSDVNKKLFVGDNSNNSIWIGAQVTGGDVAQGLTSYIPTQSAVKSYVDGAIGGGSGVVNTINATGGAITITGDGGAITNVISGKSNTFTSRIASSSLTGVASFDSDYFVVGASGHVRLAGAYQTTGDTIVQGSYISVSKTGKNATISANIPLASASATGVASFSTAFEVDGVGKVSLAAGGVGNAALANSCIIVRDEAGVTDAICLGETLTITGGLGVDFLRTGTDTYQVRGITATSSVLGVASFNSTRFSVVNGAVDLAAPYQITGDTVAAVGSVSVTRSGNVATIDNRLATTSLTGVASFDSNNFTVTNGAVALKGAVTSFNGSTGAVNFYPAIASSSVTGVASFNTTDFTVTTGAVALKGVVTSLNGLTGARTLTGDGGALQGVSNDRINARLATSSLTGVASFDTNNFTVTNGAVALKGAVTSFNGATGAVSFYPTIASASVTGVASFDTASGLSAGSTGHVRLVSVPNSSLANSSIIVAANGNNTINLGSTLTITGTANQVSVSSSSGTVTLGLPNDIVIPGNLTVNGTVVTANVNNFTVEDPLFMLGTGNSADSVDLGFYAKYDSSGTKFAGLFRDASDSGKFKLFAGLTSEPTTFVDNSYPSFSTATLIAKIDGGTF
jgi:hypothetical protein